MTNQGALEVGRSLSGGSRFLAWEAALLADPFPNDVMEVALLMHTISIKVLTIKQINVFQRNCS